MTAKKALCPGYLRREDEKLIELDPSMAKEGRCALCGAKTEAVYKSVNGFCGITPPEQKHCAVKYKSAD